MFEGYLMLNKHGEIIKTTKKKENKVKEIKTWNGYTNPYHSAYCNNNLELIQPGMITVYSGGKKTIIPPMT